MRYAMKEQELRQREPLWAALILALGWGLWLGLGLWALALLGTALALSLLRDAAMLRRSVRAGRVWIYEGHVQAQGQGYLTLRQSGQQVTLALSRPLPVQTGDRCRLVLEHNRRGWMLLALRRQRCALRLLPARSRAAQPGTAMI